MGQILENVAMHFKVQPIVATSKLCSPFWMKEQIFKCRVDYMAMHYKLQYRIRRQH